jgi:glyoxylate reductase
MDIISNNPAGISVASTPNAVNNATADIAIFLMIGALRRITVSFQAIRRGDWRGNFGLGYDPQQKVLGILGMGGIGGVGLMSSCHLPQLTFIRKWQIAPAHLE